MWYKVKFKARNHPIGYIADRGKSELLAFPCGLKLNFAREHAFT